MEYRYTQIYINCERFTVNMDYIIQYGLKFTCFCIIFCFIYDSILWDKVMGINGKTSQLSKQIYQKFKKCLCFFYGWMIAASNLSLGVLMVYWWGLSKEKQAVMFFIMTPIMAVGSAFFAYRSEGKRGLQCCWSLWLTAIWGYTGAIINSYRCFNGLQAKC